jgi:hypothetical protein
VSERFFMLADGTDAAAASAVPAWLPWALVGAGGILLLVVIPMLVKGKGAATAPRANEHAAAELADLKNRLVEVKKLAATVADDLDKRAERLERLIAQADELLERGADEPPAARGSGGRSAVGASPTVDDMAQRVFALADLGKSAHQIAQALRQPVGNIELMLALRGPR